MSVMYFRLREDDEYQALQYQFRPCRRWAEARRLAHASGCTLGRRKHWRLPDLVTDLFIRPEYDCYAFWTVYKDRRVIGWVVLPCEESDVPSAVRLRHRQTMKKAARTMLVALRVS